MNLRAFFSTFQRDLLAGTVVFLVALPLCLGIANASGVEPFAGLVSGIVGGLVVAVLSGSRLSVSGPAAGLVVIVVDGIAQLGSFSAFLLAVLLSGAIQFGFGMLKAGRFAAYVPSPVIKGMLAAIGLMLIVKQFPLAAWVMPARMRAPMSQAAAQTAGSDRDAVRRDVHRGVRDRIACRWRFWSVGKRSALRRFTLVRALPAPLAVVMLGIGAHARCSSCARARASRRQRSIACRCRRSNRSPRCNRLAMGRLRPHFAQLVDPDVWRVAIDAGHRRESGNVAEPRSGRADRSRTTRRAAGSRTEGAGRRQHDCRRDRRVCRSRR